jgi:hypothetical protein
VPKCRRSIEERHRLESAEEWRALLPGSTGEKFKAHLFGKQRILARTVTEPRIPEGSPFDQPLLARKPQPPVRNRRLGPFVLLGRAATVATTGFPPAGESKPPDRISSIGSRSSSWAVEAAQ